MKSNEDITLSTEHFADGPFICFGEQFNAKSSQWLKRINRDKSVEIFPGIPQHTDRYARYLIDLHRTLKAADLINVDETQGLCYLSSVNQCLVDWGAGPTGILPPFEDNRELRKLKGLRDATMEDKTIAQQMIRRIIGAGEPCSIHFKKVSSSGFPFMANGVELKVAMFKETVERLEEFIILTATQRYKTRFEKFRSYPLYTNGIRIQADTLKENDNGQLEAKERFSIHITGDKKGQKFLLNAPVKIANRIYPDLFCARWRSMYALSRHDNGLLQILNNYLHKGAVKTVSGLDYRGPQVTSEEIAAFFRATESLEYTDDVMGGRPDVFTLDKSEFGETFSPTILEVIIKELSLGFNESFAAFVRETLDAPTCVRGLYKDVETVAFTRETLIKREELSLRGSFKSGHGLVAFLGEFLGALDAALITKKACEMAGISWTLDSFLTNTNPAFIYKGKGDDTLFACRTNFKPFLVKAVEEGASLHKDETERFAKFLGFFYDKQGKLHTDMSKYIESETGSERGWRAKAYPELGAYMKDVLYATNPTFNEVRRILDKKLVEHFNFSRTSWIKPYERLQAYTDNLAVYLADPEKLLYQDYLREEVDDEYIKLVYEEINADYVAAVLSRIRKL